VSDPLLVAFTGATGQLYGIRLLEMVRDLPNETHLILSQAAKLNIQQESEWIVEAVQALADVEYGYNEIAAPPASGSFRTAGMVVAPCSMRTLSDIAHASTGNLITRAADVTLKERRPLVLMPREKPFNRIHLKNMLEVTDAGGIIMPPFPSFYHNPESIDDIVNRTVARTLAFFDVDIEVEEWSGMGDSGETTT
jgi:4-hydroxy-3-polyprenylbenzoate decarboxylase